MASIEVKLWYSVEDGEPREVGSATVTTSLGEDGKVSLDASNLRGLSEEVISVLEKKI